MGSRMSLEDMKKDGKSVADVKAARYTKEEAEAAGFDTTSETSGWATAPTSTVPTASESPDDPWDCLLYTSPSPRDS